jgi:mRNA interferase MazF
LVTKEVFQPGRADFIYLNFTPQAGTEQAGHRPALVLSPKNFNIATGFVAVCPITHTGTGSKFEVPIPRGAKISGFILSHQFRTLDWVAREAYFHSKANEELMWEVLGRIEAILSIERH